MTSKRLTKADVQIWTLAARNRKWCIVCNLQYHELIISSYGMAIGCAAAFSVHVMGFKAAKDAVMGQSNQRH